MSEQIKLAAGHVRRRWVAWGVAAVTLVVVATAGGAGWAQERGMGQGMGMHDEMHGGMRGGMHEATPEQIARRVDRVLDGVKATDEQRTKIKAIAQAATQDLKALHESGRGLREQGLRLLAAKTVDAAAIEALRRQKLALHDKASLRISQALVDAAQVLTPEQRVQLAERWKQRAERRHARGQDRQHEHGHPAGGASAPR